MTERPRVMASAATAWRRLLVLLIGGLVALPYGAIGVWALSLWVADSAPVAARLSSVVVLAILIVPAVLPVTRALERTVANQLLDTDVPQPRRAARPSDTWRGALFFAGHLASGGILIVGIAFVLPTAVMLSTEMLGDGGDGARIIAEAVGETALEPSTVLVWALLATALIAVLSVGAAYLLPWYAQLLLGPSRDERRELDAEVDAARRNRDALAREVHDSVGHALTVMTMQSAVARHSLTTDPDGARAALDEIERAGRGAVAELDYALAVLRGGGRAGAEQPSAQRTLTDIGLLVDETRAAGFTVDADIADGLHQLPASLGREGYRIAQEGMTNALRYAQTPTVELTIARVGDAVRITIANATSATRAIDGRGLVGVRERASMLGGRCDVSIAEGRWLLDARLPVEGPARRERT